MTPAENSRAETTKTATIFSFTDDSDKTSAHQSSSESGENFQGSDASISNNTLSSPALDQESLKNNRILSKMHMARSDYLRCYLRDVMIFLLGANACLWLFMSLNGAAFTIYQYESDYFGSSAWAIITMLCRPLSLFFRMHSAGCLFEMWSFA